MKPHGPVPTWWSDERLTALQREKTPAFFYDIEQVRQRICRLRKTLPDDVSIHYAMKANPFAPLLAAMEPLVDGVDVASGGELAMALDAGATHISFAGPGKTDHELERTIGANVTLNLESETEAGRALAIASRLNVTPRLAVRVNPPFALKGSGMKMGGLASPFGVDAERVPALVRHLLGAGADWRGLHIFAGSQNLDAEAIAETQAETVTLAAEIAQAVGATPPLINLGGGFGIPYFAGDRELDIALIGARLTETLANRPAILRDSRFAIELGRYLVGEAGVYLTRVIDRKESRGETFLIVDGGLHHQLAASGNFGTVVRRNYPVAVVGGQGPRETVSVVGCLCTPLDLLASQVELPRAEIGDVIAIFMAGAYGATASPSAFLGHGAAREILLGQ